MGTLIDANTNARGLVTEILDEALWWSTLEAVVKFLRAKKLEQVRVEFGFVLDRDLKGEQQPADQVVQSANLIDLVKAGIEEGIIEYGGFSDFRFSSLGNEISFMLCNDADLHFASTDSLLLAELGQTLRLTGLKVYDSGQLI
jgi:hypothetical protein